MRPDVDRELAGGHDRARLRSAARLRELGAARIDIGIEIAGQRRDRRAGCEARLIELAEARIERTVTITGHVTRARVVRATGAARYAAQPVGTFGVIRA